MSNLFKDVRFAFRMLLNNPAFSLIAVLVLALGIGANTAMFSVVHAVLLRPLPYQNPEELVLVWESTPQLGNRPFSQASFVDWSRRTGEVFAQLTPFRNQSVVLTGRGRPINVNAIRAGANLGDLTGVAPRIGKWFSPSDGLPGAAPVAVLTYGLWQSRYGSDPNLVGEAIDVDGVPSTVIGVMPPSFLFPPPIQTRNVIREYDPQLYLPLVPDPEDRSIFGTLAAGRLHHGLSLEQARQQLQAAAASLREERPDQYSEGMGATIAPLHEQGVDSSRTILWVLLGAVLLILLIACFNIATLLLARAAGRRREMALRSALGAGRGEILRQLLTESLLLSLLGGAAGILLAWLSLQALLELGVGFIPMIDTVSIDWAVLGFTLLAALLTGILFGLAPAVQASHTDLNEALKEGSRGNSGGLDQNKLRTVMVVAEVALAVMLLVGAGLLFKSLLQLQKIELGFDPQHLVDFQVQLPAARYPNEAQAQFARRTLEEVQQLPGIERAAMITLPPLASGRIAGLFEIEGNLSSSPEEARSRFANLRQISPEYFDTMKIPLLDGRVFNAGDRQDSPPVCVIDSSIAETYWPNASALGSQLVLGNPQDPNAVRCQTIGVVRTAKYSGLRSSWGTIYYALEQLPASNLHLLVRTGLDPQAASQSVRRQIAEIDSDLAVTVQTYDAFIDDAQSGNRSPTLLLGLFASLAVVLALGGLYGVMSYIVGRRTQEIGLRMALGARRLDIAGLVGGQTARMVAIGLALGLALAFAFSRFLSALLFEVGPGDPLTFVLVALLFLAVSGLAGFVPARRASKVDPMTALRTE